MYRNGVTGTGPSFWYFLYGRQKITFARWKRNKGIDGL